MKKMESKEGIPRHEAIVALKQIARDRNDPYLADQIETWLQRFVVEFSSENKIDKDVLAFVKDQIDFMDHMKTKGLVEVGAAAANLTAETFDIEGDSSLRRLRFRMIALRPTALVPKVDEPGRVV